jgi:hypothetical protein
MTPSVTPSAASQEATAFCVARASLAEDIGVPISWRMATWGQIWYAWKRSQ